LLRLGAEHLPAMFGRAGVGTDQELRVCSMSAPYCWVASSMDMPPARAAQKSCTELLLFTAQHCGALRMSFEFSMTIQEIRLKAQWTGTDYCWLRGVRLLAPIHFC